MIILNPRHLAATFRAMRLARRLNPAQLGIRLKVHRNTVHNRESATVRMDFGTVQQTAHVFGYDLALVPKRHPDARPTGTGWPA